MGLTLHWGNGLLENVPGRLSRETPGWRLNISYCKVAGRFDPAVAGKFNPVFHWVRVGQFLLQLEGQYWLQLYNFRSVNQLFEDVALPSRCEQESQRFRAIIEVLRRIPEADYSTLVSKIDEFDWFLPPDYSLGGLFSFSSVKSDDKDKGGKLRTHAQALYLSPVLEKRVWDLVVAVVAHECAHIVNGHSLFPDDKATDDRQETEVWDCVCGWGFAEEAKKHRASQKRKGIIVG